MSLKPKTRSATLVETLVYYDGPQLIFLQDNPKFFILAVAIDRDGFESPFFACEVREKAFNRYIEGRTDLHYLFLQAIWGKYYVFDLAQSVGKTVSLIPLTKDQAKNPDYWPGPGIFSRSHTKVYSLRPSTKTSIRSFAIDGTWGSSDFSYFHGKMSNLYGLFALLNGMDGGRKPAEVAYMKRLIQERFWQGGGSYVGFFDELVNRVRSINPMEVAKIQYSSPGEINFRGDPDIFAEISEVVSVFEGAGSSLSELYSLIHKTLGKERLLRASRVSSFSSKSLEESMFQKTHELALRLNIEKVDEIFAACDENVLIFCKVILSIYRRASELYLFHAEGRVRPRSSVEFSHLTEANLIL